MNKSELSKILADKLKTNPTATQKLIDSVGDTITEVLSKGEKVIYSNFGTFYTVHYPSKVIYHPVLGAKKKMIMLPTDAVKWMPSGNIKDMVDTGKVIESATTFGASKKLHDEIQKSGIKKKSIPKEEVKMKNETTLDEEEFDIPIRTTKSKPQQITDETVIPINNATKTTSTPDHSSDNGPDLKPFSNKKPTISYIDLSNSFVPVETLQKIPKEIAAIHKVVPVEEKDEEIIVAMIDPQNLETIELIKRFTKKIITPMLTSEDDINHILDQYAKIYTEITPQDKHALNSNPDNSSASRIINSIIKRAIRDKASDIHIEPTSKEILIRFRIDGVLYKKITLPKTINQAITTRIKNLANLTNSKPISPQDGSFGLEISDKKIDFLVSTMPTSEGEKIVIKILDKTAKITPLEKLDLRERDLDIIKNNSKKSHGISLVVGPDTSSKTTTLYALINNIYSEGINIVTIEDPIESKLSGINQSQVDIMTNYTFPEALRSILKQDPDVVMISNIDDKETATMAMQAAQNGHAIIASLPANRSTESIYKLINLGVEPFSLNSSLNLIISQRLVRRICDSCKEETTLTPNEAKIVKEEIEKLPKSERAKINKFKFFHGAGCKKCSGTGYLGRIGLYEVLEINQKTKELVTKLASENEIIENAAKDGMTTLTQDGILKALSGQTTIEEVLQSTI